MTDVAEDGGARYVTRTQYAEILRATCQYVDFLRSKDAGILGRTTLLTPADSFEQRSRLHRTFEPLSRILRKTFSEVSREIREGGNEWAVIAALTRWTYTDLSETLEFETFDRVVGGQVWNDSQRQSDRAFVRKLLRDPSRYLTVWPDRDLLPHITPLVVDYEPLGLCLSRCLFCFGAPWRQERGLSLSQVRKMFQLLRTAGTQELVFTGGAVALDPQFHTMVRMARYVIGFPRITVSTTGEWLAPHLKELVDYKALAAEGKKPQPLSVGAARALKTLSAMDAIAVPLESVDRSRHNLMRPPAPGVDPDESYNSTIAILRYLPGLLDGFPGIPRNSREVHLSITVRMMTGPDTLDEGLGIVEHLHQLRRDHGVPVENIRLKMRQYDRVGAADRGRGRAAPLFITDESRFALAVKDTKRRAAELGLNPNHVLGQSAAEVDRSMIIDPDGKVRIPTNDAQIPTHTAIHALANNLADAPQEALRETIGLFQIVESPGA